MISRATKSRHINQTAYATVDSDSFDDFIHCDIDEEFETPLDSYTVNQSSSLRKGRDSSFRGQRPTLKKEIWQGLSCSDQLAWDQVTDQGKHAIMFVFKPTPPGSKVTAATHDTNNVDESFDVDQYNKYRIDDSADPLDDSTDYDHSFLINAMKRRKPLPPGDIRKLLGSQPPSVTDTTPSKSSNDSTKTRSMPPC